MKAIFMKYKWWFIGGGVLAVGLALLGLWDALLTLLGVGVGAGVLRKHLGQVERQVEREEKVQTYTDKAIKEVYADVMAATEEQKDEDLDKRKRDLLNDLDDV